MSDPSHDPRSAPSCWLALASEAELADNSLCAVKAGQRSLVLVKRQGEVFALDNRCSHRGGPLAQGKLIDGEVACPWHGFRFDPKSGMATCPSPYDPVATYPARVRDGRVEVSVPEAWGAVAAVPADSGLGSAEPAKDERATPGQLFARLDHNLKTHPQRAAGMTAVYQFILHGPGGGGWVLTLDAGKSDVQEGHAEQPSVTVSMSTEDFVDMNTGKLDGSELFLSGRLKVVGDVVLGMRLPIFFA